MGKSKQVRGRSKAVGSKVVSSSLPAPGTKRNVFISHDTRESNLAEAFGDLLTKSSSGILKIFRSSDMKGLDGIPYGTQWHQEVMKALHEVTYLVAILTQRSFNHPWILFETGVAAGNQNTRVVAVALDLPKGSLKTTPFAHYEYCRNNRDALTKLVLQIIQGSGPKPAIEKKQAVQKRVDAFQNVVKREMTTPPPITEWFVAKERKDLKELEHAPSPDRPIRIDCDMALRLIKSATRRANFIVSVDFELKSWAYIINRKDLVQVNEKLKRKVALTLPRAPRANRLDDFSTLFKTTETRLSSPQGSSSEPPLVVFSPAIVRTFVLKKRRSQLEPVEWCILKRFRELEETTTDQFGYPIMVNKVLFLEDKPAHRRVIENGDVFLFFENRGSTVTKNLFFTSRSQRAKSKVSWPPPSPPDGFEAIGIREQNVMDRSGVIESDVIASGHDTQIAYECAIDAWLQASAINTEELRDQMLRKHSRLR